MIYRVMADFFFPDQDEANDFFHDCEVAIARAITINPDLPDRKESTASIQECHHDEITHLPCTITQEIHTD